MKPNLHVVDETNRDGDIEFFTRDAHAARQINVVTGEGGLAALRRDNAATWTLYLLGYEFFFRGFLLFAVADAWGVWAGVCATTLAYVYAHLPKNADETIGTIPMGVVFALGALWSGGIWAPWLAHVIIANTSDLLASRPRA